jgi:glycosyltransferase involved in cell wall biosynthesis
MRQVWAFEEDDVVLFFMGWLYPFAGLVELLDSLPGLPPQLKLLIVGDGEAEAELRRRIADLQLGDRVVMTGRQPYERMPQFLAAADICLLPSRVNEVTRHIVPVKIYEYMASGRPVIASRLPGVMRDVPEGQGVLYAPPGEHLRLAETMLDASSRKALGGRGRAFVEAHCDWERITDEFEALLSAEARRLTSDHRPPTADRRWARPEP